MQLNFILKFELIAQKTPRNMDRRLLAKLGDRWLGRGFSQDLFAHYYLGNGVQNCSIGAPRLPTLQTRETEYGNLQLEVQYYCIIAVVLRSKMI